MGWKDHRLLASGSRVTTTSTVEGVERKLGAPEFTRIYTEHRAFVTKALYFRGVRAHEVEDASQEVFLTLFRRSPALDSELAVRAWLREVASNVALNRARTQRRREPHRSVDAPSVELELLADERAPSPERHSRDRT
jgi:DNA-directed RNA polymerase specialized sigma24 family protein